MGNNKFNPINSIAMRLHEVRSFTGRQISFICNGVDVSLYDFQDRKCIFKAKVRDNGFEQLLGFLLRFKRSVLIQSYRDSGVKVDLVEWSRSINFLKDIYGYYIAIKV